MHTRFSKMLSAASGVGFAMTKGRRNKSQVEVSFILCGDGKAGTWCQDGKRQFNVMCTRSGVNELRLEVVKDDCGRAGYCHTS